MKHTIQVTVLLENRFWIGLFERKDDQGHAVARKIFGAEPTDAELYEFVLTHYDELNFSTPQEFTLVIKRKNPKRIKREVRREMEKAKDGSRNTTLAQDMLREELEKNKKLKKVVSKAQKEAREKELFLKKQAKRKEKQKGH
ncbi:MAG: YjdF family protein [Candidatus Berkiella sp.]